MYCVALKNNFFLYWNFQNILKSLVVLLWYLWKHSNCGVALGRNCRQIVFFFFGRRTNMVPPSRKFSFTLFTSNYFLLAHVFNIFQWVLMRYTNWLYWCLWEWSICMAIPLSFLQPNLFPLLCRTFDKFGKCTIYKPKFNFLWLLHLFCQEDKYWSVHLHPSWINNIENIWCMGFCQFTSQRLWFVFDFWRKNHVHLVIHIQTCLERKFYQLSYDCKLSW